MPTSAPDPTTERPLLAVSGLSAGYGKLGVLTGVDFDVHRGEIVALVGANGAGKTTLLSCAAGLLRDVTAGTVSLNGQDVTRKKPRAIVKRGLLYVPEGHRVFPALSVEDNLHLAGYGIDRAARTASIAEAWEVFPEIAAKRQEKAGRLSGGQQQMLVIAQGLVRRPDVLMLDEPSAGLAPVLVDRILDVAGSLRDRGVGVVIVEQLVDKVLAVSDHAYVLTQGRVTFSGAASELASGDVLQRAYLG